MKNLEKGCPESEGSDGTTTRVFENRNCLGGEPKRIKPFGKVALEVAHAKLLQEHHVLLLHVITKHSEELRSHATTTW